MIEKVKILLNEVEIFHPNSKEEVESFRLKYLGKKGEMNELFKILKDIPSQNKKEFGQKINLLKKNVQLKIDLYKDSFIALKATENIEEKMNDVYKFNCIRALLPLVGCSCRVFIAKGEFSCPIIITGCGAFALNSKF